MRRLLRLLSRERGFALPFAVGAMTVLSASVVTVIVVATSSGRTVNVSNQRQSAYTLAEAGMASAMAALHANDASGNPVDALNSSTLPPPPPDANAHRDDYPSGCTTNCIGYVLWGGTLDMTAQAWTIKSWGYVNNPTGGSALVRKMSGVSFVQPSLVQTVNNHVWNYMYSWRTSNSTTCDVTVSNNVVVSSPLYVEGNLCLSNNAKVTEVANTPPTPTLVVVKGKTAFSPGSSIGVSGGTIQEAHLAGGCGSSLSTVHTCNPASPTSDPIHARTFDTTPTAITPPTPDYTTWYNNANPGPKHPCGAGSSGGPTWDNDSTQDLTTNGSAGTLNLTPTTNYTCYGFNASGSKVGELSWNASSKTLTVSGAMYFDGNVSVSNGAVNLYQGFGTLYATGYFQLNGQLCGARLADLSGCDYSQWDPNTNMLIVVAHGGDVQNNSVVFSNNSRFQGGVYCQNVVNFSNNSVIEGPVMAGYLTFTNNVTAKPFPVITKLPLGTPGNPNVYADAQAPVVSG